MQIVFKFQFPLSRFTVNKFTPTKNIKTNKSWAKPSHISYVLAINDRKIHSYRNSSCCTLCGRIVKGIEPAELWLANNRIHIVFFVFVKYLLLWLLCRVCDLMFLGYPWHTIENFVRSCYPEYTPETISSRVINQSIN